MVNTRHKRVSHDRELLFKWSNINVPYSYWCFDSYWLATACCIATFLKNLLDEWLPIVRGNNTMSSYVDFGAFAGKNWTYHQLQKPVGRPILTAFEPMFSFQSRRRRNLLVQGVCTRPTYDVIGFHRIILFYWHLYKYRQRPNIVDIFTCDMCTVMTKGYPNPTFIFKGYSLKLRQRR